jgi:hypothetical protein
MSTTADRDRQVLHQHFEPLRPERHRVHRAVNRWLATIALLLVIGLMLALYLAGFEVARRLDSLRDDLTSVTDTGGSPSTYSGTLDPETGDFCYDPGGGTVCAPAGD